MMNRFPFIKVLYLVLGLALFPQSSRAADEAVPGELVIRTSPFSKSTHDQIIEKAKARLGKTADKALISMKSMELDSSFKVVTFPVSISTEAMISALQADSEVLYAEPNFIYKAFDLPNDPDLAKLWGLINTGQADSNNQMGVAGMDVGVLPLWNNGITGDRRVIVGVIDTGISWTHPDLMENLYTNPGEMGALASNGVDDDGNGFIDDVHGWNFDANSKNSADDNNHGSHCSGTIGGVANNGMGVAGINWNVTLMPIKFLNAEGRGTLANAIPAILYGVRMHANILSNSWGAGARSFSQAMMDAIGQARDAGILFVAAAGNDSKNNDVSPSYPANYQVENVVSVAAVDNQGRMASFSNYGSTTVHVAAPGVNVWSSIAQGNGYDSYSGTSMATPHVAGVAALIWSTKLDGNQDPLTIYAQIKQSLIETSAPNRGLRARVNARGIVNANRVMMDLRSPGNADPDPSLWRTVDRTLESNHPLGDNYNQEYSITVPGATKLRVHFARVDTETGYDFVHLLESDNFEIDSVSGSRMDFYSPYIDGDTVKIRMTTDGSVASFGFIIDHVQAIE